ncbi:MAG TPA: FAD-dependent thymidylate synthase [Anaerolineaceae bacterium]
MPHNRQVYLLDPQEFSPETIAVTFAKTSRSPESFREIAAGLTDEKSAEFNEKWVVGYGHASVAEHAVLHIAAENISRLAVEVLESNRLASYTEKSTRYQKWGPDDFYTPAELTDSPYLKTYLNTCQTLLKIYQESLPAIRQTVVEQFPRKEGESETAWERRIRSDYIDVCRFLLPSAALANVGMTINARALEHALCKMLSHPLAEVRDLGEEIRQASIARLPTLIKYVKPLPYLIQTERELSQSAATMRSNPANFDWCQLISIDSKAESRVLAAALYRFGNIGYAQAIDFVEQASPSKRQEIAYLLLGSLDEHTIPLRELEHSTFTFDVILDQGAYFELKRHRMMTQSPQALTPYLGYATPKLFSTAGLSKAYHSAMEIARQAYDQIAKFSPTVAAYVIPNGFNRRVLLTMNLRSAIHFVNLRSSPKAHFSIRRVALRIGELIRSNLPLLGQYIRMNQSESIQEIEQKYFEAMK